MHVTKYSVKTGNTICIIYFFWEMSTGECFAMENEIKRVVCDKWTLFYEHI